MGEVSSSDDVAAKLEDAAVMDGRISPELRVIPPVPVERSVRLSSTRIVVCDKKLIEKPSEVPRTRRRIPEYGIRQLTDSRADYRRRTANMLRKMNVDMKACEKRKRKSVVPD